MKIPFDIKYRSQIESGEYKVETRDGSPARVVCWDANSYTPIVFLVTEHDCLDDKDKEYTYSCNNFGRAFSIEAPRDLFIITPEEELSDFEKCLTDLVSFSIRAGLPNDGDYEAALTSESVRFAKMYSEELLSLAKKELCESGEVTDWYAKGKAEALKDLPRWRTNDFRRGTENPY